MTPWLVPAGYGEAEYVEKRSRFIGRIWRTETEAEALEHVQAMKKQHWDARHNVYAYIIRDGAVRYSDDGEPGGTAGQPVLNALQQQGFYNVCCVVTRYFGGILLGAGGLVRAYSHTAVLAAQAAGKAEMRLWDQLLVDCPYRLLERLRQELAAQGGQETEAQYGADVTLTLALPEAQTAHFLARLTELSAGTVEGLVTGQVLRAAVIEAEGET